MPYQSLLAVSTGTVVIIVAVVIILLGGFLYVAYLEWKKRIEAMGAMAKELGLDFDHKPDTTVDDRFRQFRIFCKGKHRKATNTLSGSIQLAGSDRQILMGDYEYTIETGSGSDKKSKTTNLSYLLLSTPGIDAPEVIIRKEGLFDKIGAAIGFDDIDFESAEFSKKFHVSSDSKRFAWDLIDPRMIEFLLDTESPTIEIDHGWVLFVTGKRWKVEQFSPMLEYGDAFLQRWPDHVVRGLAEGRYRGED